MTRAATDRPPRQGTSRPRPSRLRLRLGACLRMGEILLVVALVVPCIGLLLPEIATLRHAARAVSEVECYSTLLDIAARVSMERRPSNAGMSGIGTGPVPPAQMLAERRRDVDAAFDAAAGMVDPYRDGHIDQLEALRGVRAQLAGARQAIDQVIATPPAQRDKAMMVDAIGRLIAVGDAIHPILADSARRAAAETPELAGSVIVIRQLSDLRDYGGRLASLIIPAVATGQQLDATELARFNVVRGRIDAIRQTLEAQPAFRTGSALDGAAQRTRAVFFDGTMPLAARVAREGLDGAHALQELSQNYMPSLVPLDDLRRIYTDALTKCAVRWHHRALAILLATLLAELVLLSTVGAIFAWLRRAVLRPLVTASRAVVVLAERPEDVRLPSIDSRIVEIRNLFAAFGVLAGWIGERNQLVAQLKSEADADQLTGLPNAKRFEAVATRSLLLARPERFGILYVDVESLRIVNDTYGYGAGDRLLVEAAHRLRHLAGERAFVARLSGNVFAACCINLSLDEQVALAGAILRTLGEPFALDDATCTVGAYVGIAPLYDGRVSYEELCQQADIALYEAKSAGRNSWRVFSTVTLRAFMERSELKSELLTALSEQQFSLMFQPIYDLRSGRVFKCEALMRWGHPDKGLVPPDVFVPLLESSGLIDDAGRWVLFEATRIAAGWPEEIGVAVNVSPLQLLRPDFPADVAAALHRSGLAPGRLQVELTESSLIDQGEVTSNALDELRALGVSVAIDDFGTGYSSLGYLRDRRFDMLKIDKSFIGGIGSRSDSEVILRSVIELARGLGVRVVAEGVETTVQLEWLRGHHCDYVQGFLLGEPTAPDALLARFAALTGAATAGRVVGVHATPPHQ